MRPAKYTPPDGIDWRDPEMPVYEVNTRLNYVKLVQPWRSQQLAQLRMAHLPAPSWSDDPSYDMASSVQNRRRARATATG